MPNHPLASWNTWTYWLQRVQRRAIFLMLTIIDCDNVEMGVLPLKAIDVPARLHYW